MVQRCANNVVDVTGVDEDDSMSFRVIVKKSNRYDADYLLPDKAKDTLIDYLGEHCLESTIHTSRPNVIIKIDSTEIPLLKDEAEQTTMWVRVSRFEQKQIKRMAKMIGISMSYYMRTLHRGVVRAYLAKHPDDTPI